ncbi:tRNA-dihydrouridine synthase 3 [Coemansia sp. RSA 1646]|nr:tRNA-dihydrouridine synthase 3 [Coemansia sp. RSA 1646]KAJ1765811.1 tRNA-dihydrouridine synthase 3 [Coemansia sp. RSA 1843]
MVATFTELASEEEAIVVRNYDAPVKKEYLVVVDEPSSKETFKAVPKGKRSGGQNPNRGSKNRVRKGQRADKLCMKLSMGEECPHGDSCTYSHDVEGYLAAKEPDLGPTCHLYETFGKCKYGIRCRFAGGHQNEVGTIIEEPKLLNDTARDIQIRLRKKQITFPRTAEIDELLKSETTSDCKSNENDDREEEERGDKRRKKTRGSIDYRGKTYLAPLTTVGNLPFRRICKDYGVDITCSEMAIAVNLLQGQANEWALVKRHPCETIFGVQLAGNRAEVVGRAAELVSAECTVDFIDLNMGCPIDMAFNNGGGSALLANPKKIERMVRTMNHVVDCDLTVKFRTGVKSGDNVAHTLVPEFARWGASVATLHGRSRQQRYTKLADWEYIAKCHKETSGSMAFFGGGDVMSWEDYWARMDQEMCDGIMVGRGALIKPWIFKEIEERRVWDISATERLDMLKKFAAYGMEHWGTDTQGIANVRRYLLEWQSFLHRYIPAGLLEVLPQKMNDRPPAYYGRSDLETLMASDKVNDWIKLSEMILGPTPDDFTFVPKHKSNSYEG